MPSIPTERERPLKEATDKENANRFSRVEVGLATVLFLAMLVIRILAVHSHPWDSDEPQHLHVVWAWASGRLPYRDVFDNHSPLFQLLCSPLFALLGERADIVPLMRFAMVPLFALSLWCIYKIGATIYSIRTGLWAALLAGSFPPFFMKMGEFRTDVLWTALWLALLTILVCGRLTRPRLFLAGLTLGTAFSVSMKSTLMALTILLAALLLWFFRKRSSLFPTTKLRRTTLVSTGCALAGLLIVPGALLSFFAYKGALGEMYYCIIQHNIIPGSQSGMQIFKRIFSHRILFFVPALLVAATTLPFFRTAPDQASRRMFILLVAGLFFPLLHSLWSMITPQDYMPLYPVLAVAVAAPLIALGGFLVMRGAPAFSQWLLPLLLCAGGMSVISREKSLGHESNASKIALIQDVLTLTRPDEFVMDSKGNSIFRPRPFYYVLETLTMKRIARNLLEDNLPERLVETRTAVMRESHRMRKGSMDFIKRNYISVGRLQVLGQMFKEGESDFQVTIPACYTLVADKGLFTGTLDGTLYGGPRELSAGHHQFRGESSVGAVALVWARALESGYSPFHAPPVPKL